MVEPCLACGEVQKLVLRSRNKNTLKTNIKTECIVLANEVPDNLRFQLNALQKQK